MIVSGVISLVLAVHLSLVTGRWLILGLVLLGMFLGIQYSVGPFFFKSRGILHLVCLWLLLYFLPMLCASLFVQDAITWQIVALAAAYATVEMGIILINTSEDLPEDRAMGVRTTTVALGLTRTIMLATAHGPGGRDRVHPLLDIFLPEHPGSCMELPGDRRSWHCMGLGTAEHLGPDARGQAGQERAEC